MLYAVEEASREMNTSARALHRRQNSLPVLADTDELVFVPFQ
jgi:fibrillarin-like rRNA methylase